jgi:CrcB protein
MFWIFFYYSINIHVKSLIITWFLWALTTFSTFAMESFFLFDEWNIFKWFINIFLNVFLTILFVAIWFYLTKLILK